MLLQGVEDAKKESLVLHLDKLNEFEGAGELANLLVLARLAIEQLQRSVFRESLSLQFIHRQHVFLDVQDAVTVLVFYFATQSQVVLIAVAFDGLLYELMQTLSMLSHRYLIH